MRHQATALLTGDEKQVLEDLAATHQTTLSTILRAALLEFTGNPESQQAWIKRAKQEGTECQVSSQTE